MLGAPFGACTGCGKSGVDDLPVTPMWPVNGGGNAGRYAPPVASGAGPLAFGCCAFALTAAANAAATTIHRTCVLDFVPIIRFSA
jgi:hypothetical protein